MAFSFSLGDLFPLHGSKRAAKLASQAKAPRKGDRKSDSSRARRFRFEMLESRVLLSADVQFTGITASLTTGLDAVGTEIHQLLATNPLFNTYVPGVVEQRTVGSETRELSPTFGEAMSISTDVSTVNASPTFQFDPSGATLADRYDYLTSGQLGSAYTFSVAEEGDEAALRAMDIDADGQVSVDEAFKVLVVGRLNNYLSQTFLSILDQDSDADVDAADLGLQVASFLESPLPTFITDHLSDRLELKVVDVSSGVKNGALAWDAHVTVDLIQRDRFDLGYQADKLGILPDPGTPPNPNNDPFKVPVVSSMDFGSLVFGFTGVGDNQFNDGNSEFFFAAPDRPADLTDGLRAGVSIGSPGDPVETIKSGSFIGINVGFLGAHVYDPNPGDSADSGVMLDMDVTGKAVDPSNVSALGFTAAQQGVASSSGSVEAQGARNASAIATTAIEFTLKLGNDPLHAETELKLPAANYADTAAIVTALNAALGASALAGIASAADSEPDDKIEFTLVASDAAPLGFSNEKLGTGAIIAGSASSLIGVGKAPTTVKFLLGVNGVFKLVTVDVTVDADGADNLSGTPAEQADDNAITAASLRSNLQTGLTAAFGAGPTATLDSGKLQINGAGSIEITHTLTLDTLERITLTELNGAAQSFVIAYDSGAKFEVDLAVKADDGLQKADDSSYRPVGTIRVDINPFTANAVKKQVVDTIPGTTTEVVRADYVLTDAASVPLKGGASDMQTMLDFNVIGVADILGSFNEIGTWFERLAATDLLQGFDLPFGDTTLGDVLNFKDLINDSFLIDDLDNGLKAGTDDLAKLEKWVSIGGKDKLVAMFGTAQQLESRLNTMLSPLDVNGRVFTDGDGRQNLTYDVSVADVVLDVNPQTAGTQPLVVPLDFEMKLDPLAHFETSGKLTVEGKGDVSFTFGVVLGNAVDALKLDAAPDSTPLLSLNSEAGVKLNTNLALTSIGDIKPLVGRLSGNAGFHVTLINGSNVVLSEHDVTLLKSTTDNNTTLFNPSSPADSTTLIADLNAALDAAGLGGSIVAVAEPIQGSTPSARIVLQLAATASAAVARFNTVVSTGNRAYTELGLRTQAASTVSLLADAPPTANNPGGTSFTVSIDRGGVVVATVVTLGAPDTADNISLQSLVDDLNGKLPSGVVASQSGGRLALSAIDRSIDSFSVLPGDAKLGFNVATTNAALAAAGVSVLPAELIAGVQLRGGAAPSDPFGRLAANANFHIDIGGGAEAVQVTAASTSTNTSTDDLVKSVNAAIEANGDLKGKVAAINDNGRIALRALAISVHTLTLDIDGGTESAALGLADGSSAGPLAVRSADNAPVSYGVSEDVTFTVTINGTNFSAQLTRDGTILNRSLYDLAGSLNNAINAAVGGVNKNPLVATVQSGQIVIGLKTINPTTLLVSSTPVGDPFTTTVSGGIAPSAVTTFSINSTNAKFASELKLISATSTPNNASLADFIVYFRDGLAPAYVSLDSLDTDGDQKLDKTLFDLKNVIEAAAPGKIAVSVNTDGTSLKLEDLTAGTALFRVVAINGSPAAAQLGILGSDTSNLNLGEVPLGTVAADGIIDGGKLATIDLRDRIYLKDAGASAELTVKTQGVVSAEATFGFAGIKVSSTADQELFKATADLPILASQVSLRDMFAKLGDSAQLLALVGDPTLTLKADFKLGVSTFPDASALITGAGAAKAGFITSTNGDDVADTVVLKLSDMLPGSPGAFPDLHFKMVATDFGDLLKFKDIQFGNVIDALQAIATFLKQFETFSFLSDDIPVLGVSVSDLIALADDFQTAVNDFRNNPAGGIQALGQKIQEALGLPNFADDTVRDAFFSGLGINPASLPADLHQLIQFVIDGDVLRFDLRLPVGFNKGLAVDLNVGDALGTGDLVDIQGGANLAAKGYMDTRLAFGIDLTDPTKLLIYDGDTSIVGNLHAGAQNVQFNAAIGPLGVFVKDGAVNLNLGVGLAVGDGNPAPEVIDLADPSSLTDFLATLDPSLTGSVDATLPVYFPSDSEYLDDIKFSAGFALSGSNGLATTGVTLEVPDLSGIDLSSLNPFNSIPQMLDALDFFLSGLQDIMDGKVFSIDLPLVGDQLKGAADFIDDLRRDVLGPIRQYAEQAPDLGIELVQKLLYSLLGPGSAGVTVPTLLNPAVQQPLYQFLGLAGNFGGLDLLKDYDNSDGISPLSAANVDKFIIASEDDNNFQWLFRLGQSFTPDVDVNFDLGIPALALDMDVGLDITIDWDLAMGVGIGPSEGAYIFIGDQRGNDLKGDDELLLTLEVDLAQESSIIGSLGFLQLQIDESTTTDAKLEESGPGKRNTYIAAQFGVDLVNSADASDQRLSFSELGNLSAAVAVSAEAEVNLDLVARFNPDILPDAVSALLPEVGARFVLDWQTGNIAGDDFNFADSLTLLGFRNVEINMGSFITDFLGPFVEKVHEVTGPLQPIIDVITAPIPVISDLAGQPISLVDIAGMTGYVEPAMIYAIADIITLVNKIGDGSQYGDFAVPLGDFLLLDVGGTTLVTGASIMTPGYSLKGDSQFDKDNLAVAVATAQGGAIGSIGSLLSGGSGDTDSRDLVSGLSSGSEAGSSGFAFPLFDDPSLIFGLLMGKDIPLITYDLAPFGMDFSYTQKFPIWDALFVRIGGSVGLTIDLAFGYDTAGARSFSEGGFSNPLDLLSGFYVSDTNQPTGEGTDVPELILKGELFAGAELNLGIASAGAEGAIGLEVDFDLFDPNSDGKVRVDELLGNFLYEFNYGSPALAPLAIFDVTGEVYAQLRAFVEALFFKYTFEITPKITLAEFTVPFEREPFLATERGDGSLLLDIGPNSAQRLNGDTRDIDESIYVKSIADDANHVLVWGMGLLEGDAQKYKVDPTKGIFAYGGSGNDTIDLSRVVDHNFVYVLEGGVGDDIVKGSSGGGSMKGDLGNDQLTGGDGVDLIYGGEGNDDIDGGKGNDFLFGDSGVISALKNEAGDAVIGDRLRSFVGIKDGDDHVKGGEGNDIVFGGGGDDFIEGGLGVDIVLGDGGNFDRVGGNLLRLGPDQGNRLDINARGAGGKDTIFGNAGNDVLFGGASDDLIDGGADNDEIDGGAGFDTLYGGSAADTIYGGTDADIIFGFRDPQGAFFGQLGEFLLDAGVDGIDTVFGESGNDYIRGNGGNDVLHGGAGADVLFGDADDDHLYGEAGSDIMFGGADNDYVDGSDGADIAFGDDGLVVWFDFSLATTNPLFNFTGSRIRYLDSGGGLTDQLIGDSDATLRNGYAADALATSQDLIVTKTLATDGNDTVVGGGGDDVIFGGGSVGAGATANKDTLFGDFDPSVPFNGPRPSGQDIMIGDGGRVEMFGRRNARAASESGAEDGRDLMSGNDAGDFMFGGGFTDDMHGFQAAAGNEPLDGVEDNDVMLGDHGEILFNETEIANRIELVRTTYAGINDSGGSDNMFGTYGNDVMFGGLNSSSDVIEGGLGQDILLGDQGEIRFDLDGNLDTLDLIRSYRDGLGGIDIVSGGQDADVLIGGTAGDMMYGDNAGATSGAADGEDIMLGDNADVFLIGSVGRLTVRVAAMPAGTAVDLITTTDDNDLYGGVDIMAGNAKADILFGGVFGDTIYGDAASPVNALDGDDVLVGDNGLLDFTLLADTDRTTLDLVRSFRDGLGGADTLSGNAGSDIGIGGNDGDTIYGDNAAAFGGNTDKGDVLLGDNADIFTAGALNGPALLKVMGTGISLIQATDTAESTGGIDTISGNAGSDVVIGGVAGDFLFGDAATPANALDGNDVLLGDNGELAFGEDVATAVMFGLVSAEPDLTTLDRITSFLDALGATDIISGNAGADTALGGTAGDTIYGDNATAGGEATDKGDILLGDNGELLLVNPALDATVPVSGGDRIVILGGAVASIKTRLDTLATGGVDTVSGNAGGDIVLGGVYGDTLYGDRSDVASTNADDANDIILGDNGALEWLSAGRIGEITGISVAAENPALAASFMVRDANLDTLDLITTEQPNSGGRDLIFGDNGRDAIFGGTDADRLHGDSGNVDGATSTNGNDLIFGDHGRLYPQFSRFVNTSGQLVPAVDIYSRNFFAIDIGNTAGGEGDEIWGEEGDDILLGQQGDDRMWGGSGNDDMIGGHNVSGGWDELGAPVITATLAVNAVNPVADGMNDAMDGGSGDDTMAGDNAIVWRRGDDVSPRFRIVNGTTIYTTTSSTITTNVGAVNQSDPLNAVGRDIRLLDHSDVVEADPQGRFGNDVMAGGADNDVMFGELGDDLMQGDGSIDLAAITGGWIARRIDFNDTGSDPDTDQTLYFNIPEAGTDGDDYMEGNGGRDLMYGNLGQDDMIGGSSALFGLDDADPAIANSLRPDGGDTMFGGAGVRIVRNDLGMATATGTEGTGTSQSTHIVVVDAGGHARDADFMMGDNANVWRLVVGAPGDVFRTFNYDNYAGSLRIVPRAMQQLDYTLGGSDFAGGTYNVLGQAQPGGRADNGEADLIHGEAGDDIIFGMTGSDVLFGEGQDDDIVGGYGHDWISGGTGQDGVLGDDGLIYTSRNSTTGEALYGVAGLNAANTDDTKYSNGNVLDELITTPGSLQMATINKSGELKKTVDLVPFSYDANWIAHDDEFPNNDNKMPFADDIIFGGLGSDFLHGGSGDDAISGAEALDHAYVPVYDSDAVAISVLDLGYGMVGIANALVVNPTTQDPGNVLAFNPTDTDGLHLNNRFRAGEFRLYNEFDPRRKIMLTATGELDTTGGGFNFLLNFDKSEGVVRPAGTVPKATGQQTASYPQVNDDGADAIFGDLGNDWIVGGTGRDNMYGGWGNDMLQADDNLETETVGVAAPNDNESPDTHPTYEDRAYGGAGRDILIGNTGGDRLIDWVGEYNSFLVPYAPFGQASVSRTMQPFMPEFLYALSSGDGADPTRYRDAIGSVVPLPTGNNPNPSRNGEPWGELGLVLQKDFAWGDQTGAPADPQAGNIPGGKRDVLRSADFTGNNANAFVAASGTWKVVNDAYEVAPSSTSSNKDAISLFAADVAVPGYFEISATINAVKPVGGFKGNAYIIFDYYSPTDFKFAGIDISNNKIQIGQRASWGFQVLASQNMLLKAGIDYNVLVAINGSAVTMVVNNAASVSYAFAPRLDDDGVTTYGINAGMFGLGADNAKARIDNAVVQRIPPKVTLTATDTFDAAPSTLLTPYNTGWSVQMGRYIGTPTAGAPFAIATNDIAVGVSAMLKLDAVLSTTATGGVVFDLYSPTDFKWAAISKATSQVMVGHYTAKGGWVVDMAVTRTLLAGDNTLSVTLKDTTASVSLNGQVVLSRLYNGTVVDGAVGTFSRGGTTSFDSFTMQTDDAKFAPPPALLMAAMAPTQSVASVTAAPTAADIADAVAEAKRRWAATGLDAAALARLDQVNVEVANLDGLALGQELGDTIIIDADAAGYGWFIDRSLGDDGEFSANGGALMATVGAAAGRMDLLSVVAHELGHAAGLAHSADGVMDGDLEAGQRTMLGASTEATRSGAAMPPSLAPLVIDWDVKSIGTGLRVRDAASPPATNWQSRFVNHLGATHERLNPNAGLRLHLPPTHNMARL